MADEEEGNIFTDFIDFLLYPLDLLFGGEDEDSIDEDVATATI